MNEAVELAGEIEAGARLQVGRMSDLLRKLCTLRGVHYLATRFGPSFLKRIAFDEVYRSGRWDALDCHASHDLLKSVSEHTNGGAILDLGCGTGLLAEKMPAGSYSRYTGVDVSEEALRRARRRKSKNVDFVHCDIQQYEPDGSYDLIVFQESLMYLSPMARMEVLARYGRHLTETGRFLITAVRPQRYTTLIGMIYEKYRILEDRPLENSQSWRLLVFQ